MNRTIHSLTELVKGTGRSLMDHPEYGDVIQQGWSLYMRSHLRSTRFRKTTLNWRGADIDPYEVTWVSPERIEYVTAESLPKAQFKHAGDILDGDWDRLETRFEETDIYEAFQAHFEEGVAWTDTDFFDQITTQIENGRTRWDCDSIPEFERRCERLDELYEKIRANGYFSQRELAERNVTNPIENSQYPVPERFLLDEITVNVGRDGDLLFYDGRNRLSIAKVLGVEEVPVWILSRHADWQATRDEVATNGFENVDVRHNHPDLRNL